MWVDCYESFTSFNVFERIFCSPSLHLFDQKYCKNCEILFITAANVVHETQVKELKS